MKTIYFNELKTLAIHPEEKETLVRANWMKFIYDWEKVYEKEQTITVTQAKELESKYTKWPDWQLSKEDFNKLQEEISEYEVNKEVKVFVENQILQFKIEWILNR